MKEPLLPLPWNESYVGDVVVFDLDDTLALEADFLKSGFRAVEGRLAESVGAYNAAHGIREMVGAVDNHRRHFDALEQYLDSVGMRESVDMSEIVWGCRNHIPDSGYRLQRGADALLEVMRSAGVVTGVITDGRSLTQRNKVMALHLERYCHPDDILISEEQGCDKREPKSFIHFMERYPHARSYTYIGDNLTKDFIMPRRLGWRTIMLRDRGGNHFQQPVNLSYDSYPPVVINDFHDMIWKNET